MSSLPHLSPTGVASVDLEYPATDNLSAEWMKWVQSCPQPTGIRVYLQSSTQREQVSKIQRSLQSLGCTVTYRTVAHS